MHTQESPKPGCEDKAMRAGKNSLQRLECTDVLQWQVRQAQIWMVGWGAHRICAWAAKPTGLLAGPQHEIWVQAALPLTRPCRASLLHNSIASDSAPTVATAGLRYGMLCMGKLSTGMLLTSKSWQSVLRVVFLRASLALTTSSNKSSTFTWKVRLSH